MTIFNAYVASAFSKDDKGGNKAGVIIGRRFTEAQKTEIAGYLRYSETVFVSISTFNDFKLEYFTSKGEIPLCGHATIAAFTVLRHLGLLKNRIVP